MKIIITTAAALALALPLAAQSSGTGTTGGTAPSSSGSSSASGQPAPIISVPAGQTSAGSNQTPAAAGTRQGTPDAARAATPDNAQLFQALDTNADGSISREELARWQPAAGQENSTEKRSPADRTDARTGTGGAGTDASGARAGSSGSGNKREADRFQALDTNADGKISKEEFARWQPAAGQDKSAEKSSAADRTDARTSTGGAGRTPAAPGLAAAVPVTSAIN